jgi:transcriptional regulator of acetoin/glycerol metabolism
VLETIPKPLTTIVPLVEVKRRAVAEALDQCHGNRLLAARLLGIGKTTLYRMEKVCKSQLTQYLDGNGLQGISG